MRSTSEAEAAAAAAAAAASETLLEASCVARSEEREVAQLIQE